MDKLPFWLVERIEIEIDCAVEEVVEELLADVERVRSGNMTVQEYRALHEAAPPPRVA